MKFTFSVVVSFLVFLPFKTQAQEWTDVFNGTDLTGLKLYATGNGKAEVTPGLITCTGQDAYLATLKTYSHFRTKVEWNNGGGNSGMLFHVGQDRIWPMGLECQMESSDVGSLWTTGCRFNSTGAGSTYSPTGGAITGFGTTGTARNNFRRSVNPNAPNNAWNTWEMFVKGDSLEITVNSMVTMRAWRISVNNAPLVSGRIGLQIEGARVQWRNWKIQDLTTTEVIAYPKPAEKSEFLFSGLPGGAQRYSLLGRLHKANSGTTSWITPLKIEK